MKHNFFYYLAVGILISLLGLSCSVDYNTPGLENVESKSFTTNTLDNFISLSDKKEIKTAKNLIYTLSKSQFKTNKVPFDKTIEWTVKGEESGVPFGGTFYGKKAVKEYYSQFRSIIDVDRIKIVEITSGAHYVQIKTRLYGQVRSTRRTLDIEMIYSFSFNRWSRIIKVDIDFPVESLELASVDTGRGHIISDISVSPGALDVFDENMAIRDYLVSLPVDELRALGEGPAPVLPADGVVEYLTVEGIAVEVVRAGVVNNNKIILHFHGGAFVILHPSNYNLFDYNISKSAGVPVMNVDYRLAPENPFPAGLEDCLAVYRELLNQYDSEDIILLGDSAGGNLIFTVMLLAKEEGLPFPGGVIGLSPWLDLTNSGQTMETNRDLDAVITRELLDMRTGQYLQGLTSAYDPLATPLFGDSQGFPPVYLAISTYEVLLDDSRRMFNLLSANNVNVTIEMMTGMVHVWPFFGAPELEITNERVGTFAKRVFGIR